MKPVSSCCCEKRNFYFIMEREGSLNCQQKELAAAYYTVGKQNSDARVDPVSVLLLLLLSEPHRSTQESQEPLYGI